MSNFKFHPDRLTLWIGYLTIEFYCPAVSLLFNYSMGISFNTQILYQNKTYIKGWYPYGPSLVLRFLGFGIGFSWKHTDNPIMQGYDYND